MTAYELAVKISKITGTYLPKDLEGREAYVYVSAAYYGHPGKAGVMIEFEGSPARYQIYRSWSAAEMYNPEMIISRVRLQARNKIEAASEAIDEFLKTNGYLDHNLLYDTEDNKDV